VFHYLAFVVLHIIGNVALGHPEATRIVSAPCLHT
jgi:hypothetical protein